MGSCAAARDDAAATPACGADTQTTRFRAGRARRAPMPPRALAREAFSPDIRAFLALLHAHRVRYLLAGGEAVIFYGHARLTGDVDVFYEPTKANCARLYAALAAFWEGKVPGVRAACELEEPRMVLQFGRPPYRLDLLNSLDGVAFFPAWKRRKTVRLGAGRAAVPVHYLGLGDLLRNKRACGRPRDLEDVKFLAGPRPRGSRPPAP